MSSSNIPSPSGAEAYEPGNIEAFRFTSPEQQADILREVTELKTGMADSGQSFSAIHANRDFGGRSLIVRPNSLFGSTANADQQYIASQYAIAFPDRGYLSIDLPAHGASDVLTDEQRRQLSQGDGSLSPVARAQLEAILHLVPDTQDITLAGEAAGELLAVEFAAQAAEKGVRVHRLFGFDPMGMENRSPLALAGRYLSNAARSRIQRRSEADQEGEQELEDAFSKNFVPLAEASGPAQFATVPGHAGLLRREREIFRMMLRKSPVTRDIGMQALEAALETQPELRAAFVFAGNSPVGRLTDPVKTKLRKLQKETDGRVKFTEWPDDGQDIGLARHQPRLISYVKDNL